MKIQGPGRCPWRCDRPSRACTTQIGSMASCCASAVTLNEQNLQRTKPSTNKTQEQDEDHCAREACDEDPALERRIEDDLAAARLLGQIGQLVRRSGLCGAFSDHDDGLAVRLLVHPGNASRLQRFLDDCWRLKIIG